MMRSDSEEQIMKQMSQLINAFSSVFGHIGSQQLHFPTETGSTGHTASHTHSLCKKVLLMNGSFTFRAISISTELQHGEDRLHTIANGS